MRLILTIVDAVRVTIGLILGIAVEVQCEHCGYVVTLHRVSEYFGSTSASEHRPECPIIRLLALREEMDEAE